MPESDKLLPSESQIQKSYFDLVRRHAQLDQRYKLIVATPNQGFSNGHWWGHQRLAEGMSPGFPDVSILLPSVYEGKMKGGLFLEFKTLKGQLSITQKEWIERLNKYGYVAEVVRSFDKAWDRTTEWIANSPF